MSQASIQSRDSTILNISELSQLNRFLSAGHISCSPFELIQCYSRCWKMLPETVKSGETPNEFVNSTLKLVKSSYTSLLDLLPRDDNPAVLDGNSQSQISHRRLLEFVQDFRVPVTGRTVAVALPNGAMLAVASLAVATYYTLAPLNISSTSIEQFRSDLLRTGAQSVLVLHADVERLGLSSNWHSRHGIRVVIVEPADDLTFEIPMDRKDSPLQAPKPNGPDDTCLILFTSGTSGTQKVVPFPLHTVISGVAFVGASWQLTENDVCLNMMPLNHIGGILRNLLAPILLGGSTICCSAFDPNLFWDIIEDRKLSPTWYYASPSMHIMILEEAENREVQRKSSMRMVCNAAGGLLPSLAERLHNVFHCAVLPSYGMTECMPISAPPLDYKLNRPGTSGISVGPELAILDIDDKIIASGNMNVGRICIRGEPTFSGYLIDGKIDTSVFTAQGWFDTGDLGYVDHEGYLYITGRSKEVINRGGELISPFEVEEAVMNAARIEHSCIKNRITECMAFSAPHDMLQEVVGLAIVTPTKKPRPDLRQIHESLKNLLHPTKIPVVLVYMQSLPKRNGKLCRIGMAQRLGLEVLRADSPATERHFEAVCSPVDSHISVPIEKWPYKKDKQLLLSAISHLLDGRTTVTCIENSWTGFFDINLVLQNPTFHIQDINIEVLKDSLRDELDGLLIPGIIKVDNKPKLFLDKLGDANVYVEPQRQQNKNNSLIESQLREIYSRLLSIPSSDIPLTADFWDLGGDSLRAGRLLSAIRKEFNVRIPIDKLFSFSSIQDVACVIEDIGYVSVNKNSMVQPTIQTLSIYDNECPPKKYSSTTFPMLLIHMLPLITLAPFQKAMFWVIFLKAWGKCLHYFRNSAASSHFFYLLLSMLAARIFLAVISPLIAITAKWLIVGRYKEGLYPMWSPYQSRIWLADKIIESCGLGVFQHFNWSRVLYHRLLGAKIGHNVLIHRGTTLGEHDLLTIEDDVELDRCVCRGLAAERNATICLAKVRMGKGSGAGLKSVIAPGTKVPNGICLGSNSSSWEWREATSEVNASNFDQLSSKTESPHWLLWAILGAPTVLFIHIMSCLPWVVGLYGLNAADPPKDDDMVLFVVGWFSNPSRIGFHFLARVFHTVLGPAVFLSLVIALKKFLNFMFGKLQPTSVSRRSQIDRLRLALEHELLHDGIVGEVAAQFGTHYEITSIIYRLLGAKVGKRVYWPGNGPSVIGSYDFVEVGNDVVFGSRSYIVTSDGLGTDYVRIGNGAMVADRVIVLPGCNIGDHCILGSGTLAQRDVKFAKSSTWIGNRAGEAVCLSSPSPLELSNFSSSINSPGPGPFSSHSLMKDPMSICWEEKSIGMHSKVNELFLRPPSIDSSRSGSVTSNTLTNDSLSTLYSPNAVPHSLSGLVDKTSPFGRAFYSHLAPYHVISLRTITAYSIFVSILISIYWNIPTILSLQFLSTLSHQSSFASSLFKSRRNSFRPLYIFISFFISFSILTVLLSLIALAVCIVAKWVIIGRRKPGDYDWDKSPYCQRWQILLTVERIRRGGSMFSSGASDILALLTGTNYLVAYYRLLGAKIGKHVALFCGGRMTLPFTEPDLLTLGDNICVDDASLVAHINSRGNFQLNELYVGSGSALRTGSRLLSGAAMGNQSFLMEHTLVMAGEEVDDGGVWQGWPAEPGAFDMSQRLFFSKYEREGEGENDDDCGGFELVVGFWSFQNVYKSLRRRLGSMKNWLFRGNGEQRNEGYERIHSQRNSKQE